MQSARYVRVIRYLSHKVKNDAFRLFGRHTNRIFTYGGEQEDRLAAKVAGRMVIEE